MGRVEKVLFGWLVAMLVAVVAVVGYVLIEHATRCSRFHFSATEWRDPHAHRNEMANRLVQCHRLEGLRSAEVLAKLGRPNERYHLRPHGPVYWSYDAGSDKGFVFETFQSLDVEILSTGTVRGARIVDLPAFD